MAKLSVRGSIANGAAKWATVKSGQPMPVWYVFSGAEIHNSGLCPALAL